MTNREIDALVAEKVMGYRFVQNRSHSGIRQVEAILPTRLNEPILTNAVPVDHSAWDGAWQIGSVPAYSTDIAAAWTVVEKMRERGLWAKITSPFSPEDMTYWCGFTPMNMTGWNGVPDFKAKADNAPMAICLAALAAVGVKVTNVE